MINKIQATNAITSKLNAQFAGKFVTEQFYSDFIADVLKVAFVGHINAGKEDVIAAYYLVLADYGIKA